MVQDDLGHGREGSRYDVEMRKRLIAHQAALEKDAARWRAFVRVTGHETDMSTGPGVHKDMHIRLNCTGCECYTESGAPDWKATLEKVMDDEIRLQAEQIQKALAAT